MMLPKFVVVVMDMGMMSFMLVRTLGARRCMCKNRVFFDKPYVRERFVKNTQVFGGSTCTNYVDL